jgi:hypothetical protein
LRRPVPPLRPADREGVDRVGRFFLLFAVIVVPGRVVLELLEVGVVALLVVGVSWGSTSSPSSITPRQAPVSSSFISTNALRRCTSAAPRA